MRFNRTQARAAHDLLQLTRHWLVNLGGVYVPADKAAAPEQTSPTPLQTAATNGGDRLAKIPPAVAIRQISEHARTDAQSIGFHVTSLTPIRPANMAQGWERVALASFDKGSEEYAECTATEYRYMTPLVVTKPCLHCHAHQGYKLGEVRGGVALRLGGDLVQQPLGLASAWAEGGFAGAALFGSLAVRGVIVRRRRSREAEAAKTAFVASVGHELKTPIHCVLGMLDLALDEDDAALDPHRRDHLAYAKSAAQRLAGLVERLVETLDEDADARCPHTPFSPGLLLKEAAEAHNFTLDRVRLSVEAGDEAVQTLLVGKERLLRRFIDSSLECLLKSPGVDSITVRLTLKARARSRFGGKPGGAAVILAFDADRLQTAPPSTCPESVYSGADCNGEGLRLIGLERLAAGLGGRFRTLRRRNARADGPSDGTHLHGLVLSAPFALMDDSFLDDSPVRPS